MSSECLSPALLRQLANGQLDDATRDQAQAHVTSCLVCTRLLLQMGSNTASENGSATSDALPTGEVDAAELNEALPRGARIGRYLLLDRLGSGGMGVVYAAYDAELDRRVALKLLNNRAIPSTSGRARLMREAQALAKLSHPNVVAVHDVLSVDERVVMVMELIEGITLRAWLKESARTVREVLAIFEAAGAGLAAAHAKGLIHRDFKPENVLVGKDGRIRVADFGIARVSERREEPVEELGNPELTASGSMQLTRWGELVGTLAYMAPEQLRGGLADERSDQFSFAVSLYESIAGTRPFRAARAEERLEEIEKTDVAALPSSSKLPAWVLRPLLRALSADAQKRFDSIEAFLVELRRDPAQWRRRVVVAAGATAALLLAGGWWHRAELQKRQRCAEQARAPVEAVWGSGERDSAEKAFAATNVPFAASAWSLAEKTLNAYVQDWTRMRREACEATLVRGEQSEQLLVLRNSCLDERLQEVTAVTRLYLKADAKVVERTAQVLEGLSPVAACADIPSLLAQVKPPANPVVRQKVEALKAQLAEGRTLLDAGKYSAGAELARRSYEAAQKVGYVPIEAEAENLLGQYQYRMDEYSAGRVTLIEAIQKAESAGDDLTVASAALRLSSIHSRSAEYARMREWVMLAQGKLKRVGGSPDLDVRASMELALAEMDQGRYQESYDALSGTLALAQKKLGADHSTTLGIRFNRGMLLKQLGRLDEAHAELTAIRALAEQRLGPSHPFLLFPNVQLGRVRALQDNDAEAREYFDQVLKAAAPVSAVAVGSDAEVGLGDVELSLSNWAQALQHYERALELREKVYSPDHPEVASVLVGVALSLHGMGREAPALAALQRAGAIAFSKRENHHDSLPGVLQAQARFALDRGDATSAAKSSEEAIAILEKSSPQSLALASAHAQRAEAWIRGGEPEKALPHLEKAVRLCEAKGGKEHRAVTQPLILLAWAKLSLGKSDEAQEALTRVPSLLARQPQAIQLRATARWVMARALKASGGSATETRKLAEDAVTDFGALPAAQRSLQREVKAFLGTL